MANLKGSFYCTVIGGIISEKGSKRDMLRRVRAIKTAGGEGFLGYTPRPIGEAF